ncbi:uncharacterized protein LOC117653646 [Thrips palmi]|uniref:Uncharacterized protein LOC117653646 n=1 Tax=Thrips palmi TaxID=161013 RepID=A0A6P9AB36_THRPL|nr:uncharacterized protein LOC117653646 [Thrips palmi]
MQSQLTECYRAAITAIKLLLPGYEPKEIMCDFENSQQKALSIEFPIAQRRGCHFHFTKANLLHAKEMGLAVLIQDDGVCDSIMRCLCAIPLLHADFIIDGVLEMAEYTQRSGRWNQLATFFDYIERTWLRPSRLPILSVYKCEHRTSNACESYHHALNVAMGQLAHPNVYKVLSALVRLEDRYVQDLVVLKGGRQSTRNRKMSSICNDEIVKGLTAELEEEEISIHSFLRKASRRLQSLYNEVLGLVLAPHPVG